VSHVWTSSTCWGSASQGRWEMVCWLEQSLPVTHSCRTPSTFICATPCVCPPLKVWVEWICEEKDPSSVLPKPVVILNKKKDVIVNGIYSKDTPIFDWLRNRSESFTSNATKAKSTRWWFRNRLHVPLSFSDWYAFLVHIELQLLPCQHRCPWPTLVNSWTIPRTSDL
jgi:hypothetical protein